MPYSTEESARGAGPGETHSEPADISDSGHIAPLIHRIPIASIEIGDYTPRLSGDHSEHIRLLAETVGELPPIVVHRSSMAIVDGLLRLRAARLRGDTHISAFFFEGDDGAAFVYAVKANIAHGKPLTFDERVAAARRILESHPQWSNGYVAALAGLAVKTVARVRQRSDSVPRDLGRRLGLDGRTRPTDASVGRALAAELIRRHPEASLRQIARDAGISPTTVQNVRARMHRGEDPISPSRGKRGRAADSVREQPEAIAEMIGRLRRDPAVRLTDGGKELLRIIGSQPLAAESWQQLATRIPPHCTEQIARIAAVYAACWENLANELISR